MSRAPVRLLVFFVIFASLLLTIPAAAEEAAIAFVRRGNIWVANAKGSWEKQLTFSGQDTHPAISPDGKWVAYITGTDESPDLGSIYLVPARGGPAKRFSLRGIRGGAHPAFSPDGTSLIFAGVSNMKTYWIGDDSISFANVALIVIDLLSLTSSVFAGSSDVLIDTGRVYAWPSFSPDGRQVAYSEHTNDLSGGLEVIESGGKPVFHFPQGTDSTPYWRPRFDRDGSAILCYGPGNYESSRGTIYLVNVQKGTKRRITEGSNPTFVSHGRAIIFERPGADSRATSDLWYLDLFPGATPRKIVSDGSQPSGRPLAK